LVLTFHVVGPSPPLQEVGAVDAERSSRLFLVTTGGVVAVTIFATAKALNWLTIGTDAFQDNAELNRPSVAATVQKLDAVLDKFGFIPVGTFNNGPYLARRDAAIRGLLQPKVSNGV
jgi:hypothetical protein